MLDAQARLNRHHLVLRAALCKEVGCCADLLLAQDLLEQPLYLLLQRCMRIEEFFRLKRIIML